MGDERTELLAMLAELRHNLLITVQGIDDEQARRRTTASELTLGGILNHVTNGERTWLGILTGRHDAWAAMMDTDQYRMGDDQTIAGLIAEYKAVAAETDRVVADLPDLDRTVPLPEAPWWPEKLYWSARHILLHIIHETAHHSGHADIIRESLDGASTTRQWAVDAGMMPA
jgi:uncharacterized damage-inducible protein DinB